MIKLVLLINQCDECKLSTFIDCACDGKLRGLIKFGIPTKKQLQKAWQDLSDDYTSKSGSIKGTRYISILAEILELKAKHDAIKLSIFVLTNQNSDIAFNCISNFGYTVRPEFLMDDLEKVNKQIGSILLEIKLLEKELSEIKIDKGKAVTRQDFNRILAQLWKYQGSRIDPKKIYVTEFLAICDEFAKEQAVIKEHLETLKNK